ncbi:MAG: hypothetical protein JO252_15500 [Planctomycetaceae bacterium]|nr:hypothetical protein [Planctomycetaceae bacterium]
MRNLIAWDSALPLEPGCTALIGMCSRFPDVLPSNLICLNDNAWPELKEAIIVVDNLEGSLPAELERRVAAICTNFVVRFLYYDDRQFRTAERYCLPYVYCWLSWCIGLAQCTTTHVLLHDYDALILSDFLERRYRRFVEEKLKIQGIAFVNRNGVVGEDRLAATFDAFVDVAWLRSFPPIRLLNKVKSHAGRLIDYDITLDVQHNEITDSERDIVPMPLEDFVHPSQMVHQYTMFRRHPAKALPCFSVPMIPFYEYISVGKAALSRAIAQIRSRTSKCFPFLGEGLLIDFERLDVVQVDWCLKQIVQCCIGRKIEPFPELYQYGLELYHLVESPEASIWVGDFTEEQRAGIERSSSLCHV